MKSCRQLLLLFEDKDGKISVKDLCVNALVRIEKLLEEEIKNTADQLQSKIEEEKDISTKDFETGTEEEGEEKKIEENVFEEENSISFKKRLPGLKEYAESKRRLIFSFRGKPKVGNDDFMNGVRGYCFHEVSK